VTKKIITSNPGGHRWINGVEEEGLDAETGRQQHRIGTDGGNRRGGQDPSRL
jgi:hypothetical protein